MGSFLVIVAVIAIAVLVMFAAYGQAKTAADERASFEASHPGWAIFMSPYGGSVIGLDHKNKLLALGTRTQYERMPFTAISAVEVLKDGASVTTTNRGSQALGAAIGGLAFGPVGFLAGSLTGRKKAQATVHELGLKIIVDSPTKPTHIVTFFKSPPKNGTSAQSAILKPFMERLDTFHGHLVNAMRQSQANVALAPRPALAADTTDKLSKLWELHQAGALTQEEFAAQKVAILGAPTSTALASSDL
jgi:hypothetical protein